MQQANPEFDKQIKDICTSGPLNGVRLFGVRDGYFELHDATMWIIDAGIELSFPAGKITLGWSSAEECQVFHLGSFEEIYQGSNAFIFEPDEYVALDAMQGKKASAVNLRTMEFDFIHDYTMVPKKEMHYVELALEFEGGGRLQIAPVYYSLENGESPKGYHYELSGDILISVRETIEISDKPFQA